MEFKHVYGPVDSRRFGRTLGVSVIPGKACNCDCIFCGLGRTTSRLRHRQGFDAPDEILAEIRTVLQEHGSQLEHITFCGEGEPTLYQSLGYLIVQTKQLTDVPVAVGTNGTLLRRDDVVRSLQLADVVAPSLCAADPDTFSRLHRPGPNLKVDEVIDGLVRFKREFGGQLWMELMLFAEYNDGEAELEHLREALDRIGPDRIYVVTPGHARDGHWAQPPDAESMARARAMLPDAIFLEQPAAPTHQSAVSRHVGAALADSQG